MLSNTCPKGVRFGVIAMQSLDADLQNDLWHGPDAVDLSYQDAYNDAKADAERRFDAEHEEAIIAAAEVDHEMSSAEIERFIDRHLDAVLGETDREQFVEDSLEAFSDQCEIEEPVVEGTYQGIKYRISWLGGAPLLWVLEGPVGYASRLCSPCVPNAANLDCGFNEFQTTDTDNAIEYDIECYVVPRDWLAVEFA